MKKIWLKRSARGSLKIIILFKCCNEGFCNRLKYCQNAQNYISEVLKI